MINQLSQPLLEQVYCVFTGEPLSQATTDAYNKFTIEHNSTEYKDLKRDLLDQRHKFIVMASYMNKNKKKS